MQMYVRSDGCNGIEYNGYLCMFFIIVLLFVLEAWFPTTIIPFCSSFLLASLGLLLLSFFQGFVELVS